VSVIKEKDMTVYVVQEVEGRNVLSASNFGKLEVVLPSKTNLMLTTAPAVRTVKRILSGFSDEDYLLLMGDPASIGLCCAVAAAINHGRFKVLKWDRQSRDYYGVELDLYSKSDSDNLGALDV